MNPLAVAPLRTARLSGGATLTVRPMMPSDADGLARLYEGLSDDDRYRRFFSLYRPDRSTIESWAADNEHGKIRLAAVVSPADGAGEAELVGDGLCVPLPDGDGEFALTVAAGWRGWLGPYLLDALGDAAAAAGMRNMQADILNDNRRMMAVVSARGHAVMAHPDFTETRVTTGTGPPIPTWPCIQHRPRILIEARGNRSMLHRSLQNSGFEVLTCPGPGRRCPVLAGRPCPLVLGADALVFAVPPGDPAAGPLLVGHSRLHPCIPRITEEAVRSGPSALLELIAEGHAGNGSRSVVGSIPPPLPTAGRQQKGATR